MIDPFVVWAGRSCQERTSVLCKSAEVRSACACVCVRVCAHIPSLKSQCVGAYVGQPASHDVRIKHPHTPPPAPKTRHANNLHRHTQTCIASISEYRLYTTTYRSVIHSVSRVHKRKGKREMEQPRQTRATPPHPLDKQRAHRHNPSRRCAVSVVNITLNPLNRLLLSRSPPCPCTALSTNPSHRTPTP